MYSTLEVYSSVLNANIYLATANKASGYSHLETKAKSVKVTNTFTNEVQIFRRVIRCTRSSKYVTVQKYLNTGNTYRDYQFEYTN